MSSVFDPDNFKDSNSYANANYYVYQYATSLCAAEAVAANIFNEGQPAVDKYLNFLKSGKSKYADLAVESQVKV